MVHAHAFQVKGRNLASQITMKFKTFSILIGTTLALMFLWFSQSSNRFIPRIDPEKLKNSTTTLVPKLIHQTYKDQYIPAKWWHSYENCRKIYPDFKFVFWTDNAALAFITEKYPWFQSTFEGYKYPIQRVDALRYFILYHYGGIYMDLDVGCESKNRIEPLLAYDAIIPETKPIGYSNDMMISRPGHPFFALLTKKLQTYDRNYIFPYLTVFLATGPMFLSQVFKSYDMQVPVYVLPLELYSDGPKKLFKHIQGSTWHGWDAELIKFIWTVKLYLFAFLILMLIVFIKRRRSRRVLYRELPTYPV